MGFNVSYDNCHPVQNSLPKGEWWLVGWGRSAGDPNQRAIILLGCCALVHYHTLPMFLGCSALMRLHRRSIILLACRAVLRSQPPTHRSSCRLRSFVPTIKHPSSFLAVSHSHVTVRPAIFSCVPMYSVYHISRWRYFTCIFIGPNCIMDATHRKRLAVALFVIFAGDQNATDTSNVTILDSTTCISTFVLCQSDNRGRIPGRVWSRTKISASWFFDYIVTEDFPGFGFWTALFCMWYPIFQPLSNELVWHH